jgi:hypothetical protein
MNKMPTFTQNKGVSQLIHVSYTMKQSQTECKFMPLDGENMEFSGSEMELHA